MQKRGFFVVIAIVSLVLICGRDTHSQSPAADGHKFEVGGQFSVLNNSVVSEANATVVICVQAPCPPKVNSFSKSRKTQPGFGGRFGYNLTDDLAIEAELNFFPKADLFSPPDAFNDGNLIEGLFGLKAGKRFEKAGIFAKARPGLLYVSKDDLQPAPGSPCGQILTPPVDSRCFQTSSKNSFAFDLGGVVELYPTKRTLIRLDVGDTIVRLDKRNVTAGLNPLPSGFPASSLVIFGVPAETTHNFQGSVGIGFRF
jgi:hypothetical protein